MSKVSIGYVYINNVYHNVIRPIFPFRLYNQNGNLKDN